MGHATYLQALAGPSGEPLMRGGAVPALAVVAALALGTFGLGAAAALISRHGLGDGFAVLLAVGALGIVLETAHGVLLAGAATELGLLVVLALLLVVPLLVAHRRRGLAGDGPRVPVPTCGLAVVAIPGAAIGALATLGAWFEPLGPLAAVLGASAGAGTAVRCGLTVGLALLLARLFSAPAAVLRSWERVSPERFDVAAAGDVRRALGAANVRSVVLVAGVSLLPTATNAIGGLVLRADAFLALAVIAMVGLDLADEARARAGGVRLASAWGLHRVHAADPALAALAAAGIPAHARALRYRALFHFFAPYTPVEILVPVERSAEAEAVCARIAAP